MIFDKIKKFFKRNKNSDSDSLLNKAKKSENSNESGTSSVSDDTLGNVSGGVNKRETYDPNR